MALSKGNGKGICGGSVRQTRSLRYHAQMVVAQQRWFCHNKAATALEPRGQEIRKDRVVCTRMDQSLRSVGHTIEPQLQARTKDQTHRAGSQISLLPLGLINPRACEDISEREPHGTSAEDSKPERLGLK